MEIKVAKCNNPKHRASPVIPDADGKCSCGSDVELLSTLEDIKRAGVHIPPIFLVAAGNDSNGTPKYVPASPVPPDVAR